MTDGVQKVQISVGALGFSTQISYISFLNGLYRFKSCFNTFADEQQDVKFYSFIFSSFCYTLSTFISSMYPVRKNDVNFMFDNPVFIFICFIYLNII